MTRPLEERLANVDVLVLDVDGVLTDGRVIYSDRGAEVQAFDVRDGTGLALWRRAGKRAARSRAEAPTRCVAGPMNLASRL